MTDSERLIEELRRSLEGPVLSDEITRSLYSSGGSIYRVKPLAVVQPKSVEDVVAAVRFAGRHGVPLTPRGGGTSRTGNELGEGIVLDFAKHMNRVVKFNADERWVRVQPGIVQAALNDRLRKKDLFFPVDPSTSEWCTIGGMVSNNSSGPHAVAYGTTRNYVLAVDAVLSSGEVIRTGPEASGRDSGERPLEARIYRELPGILDRHRKALAEEKPFVLKNSSGYDLWTLESGNGMDLTPLFVGAEGTLGVLTEVTLRLVPLPGKTLSGLVYFDRLEHVGEATQRILELSPSMVEIMERKILDLAREQKAEMRSYLPEGVEAILYVEFQGESDADLREKFAALEQSLVREHQLASDLKVAKNRADMAMFGKVRSVSGPILNKMKGPKRPVAFIEDAAVHPSRLPEYIRGLRELFRRFGVEAAAYGHAGDGNLHTMAFLDLRQDSEVEKMVALTEACYELVLSLKGTISGEHGDGRLRTAYVKKQYPGLYPAMVEVKALFDPCNILNPGCVVEGPADALVTHLKFGPEYRPTATGSVFDGASLQEQVEACSGCGKCRSYCAIARTTLEEWAAGRGKATLVREILAGHLEEGTLDQPEFKAVMDACINCKRCLTECPSGVDIPWLAMSGRTDFVQRHGEDRENRLLADTRALCETGSALAPLANLANSLLPFRWGMEQVSGVDRRRRLPPFRWNTLRKQLRGRTMPSGDREVVYFLSCFGNFNEPEAEGLAVVEVLERNGFRVLIPDVRCCGIARISAGAVEKARHDIEDNVSILAPYAEKGVPIVFTEPSCALALKTEYPRILGTPPATAVAAHCHDIHAFLLDLHRRGELNLDFRPIHRTLGYHNPCHARALGVAGEPLELLRLIPGLEVRALSDRCCGMGGTYGLKRKNFDLSMAMGSGLFEEIDAAGVDEVVTGCGACGMQILQGTGRRPAHPISLLASAYRKGAKATRARSGAYAEERTTASG